MLTHGIESDIFFQNHLIIFYMELFLKIFVCLVVKSAVNFFTHTGNTLRCSLKTLSVNIFADSFKKKLDRLFNFRFVYHK